METWRWVALTVISSVVIRQLWSSRTLPPGPRGLPVAGNVLDLPPRGVPEHEHWLQLKHKYGPLSSVTLFGQTMVLIHDREVAADILDKAATSASGRPNMEFALRVCGYQNIIATRQTDATFRKQRKLIHQQFGTAKRAARFDIVQREQLLKLLEEVLHSPNDLVGKLKTAIGAIILRSTYDYRADTIHPDPLIRLSQRVMKNFSKAAMPMTWIVDVFPALKHLPDWLPGATFKSFGKQCKATVEASADIPFEFARRQKSRQPSFESYVTEGLRQCEAAEMDGSESISKPNSDTVKWTAAALFGAGTDTTAATLESFILAMLEFPHVQTRAQQELDAVVGSKRLPELADRPNLPYVNALVKEIYRWHPAVPLSLPRMASADVICRGYLIPKGSYILPSLRWFCHDQEVYTDPEVFDPERFLPPRNELDPRTFVFGHRSRLCLGRYFADSTIFQTATLLLAIFKIDKTANEKREYDVNGRSTAGIIDFVKPFECKVSARSSAAKELLSTTSYSMASGENDAAEFRDAESLRDS